MAKRNGATPVYFPQLENLASQNLSEAVASAHPGVGRYKLRRFTQKARSRLEDLLASMREWTPECPDRAVRRARTWFEENRRDLSSLVSYEKDPTPEQEDIRIMIKASKAATGRPFILSRDAHFIGYADMIRGRWGIEVIDPRERPMIADHWRSA